MSELEYIDSLYCINCGEDENLAFLNKYPTTDKYKCRECNNEFHVTSISED